MNNLLNLVVWENIRWSVWLGR